jgi:repressor LexA
LGVIGKTVSSRARSHRNQRGPPRPSKTEAAQEKGRTIAVGEPDYLRRHIDGRVGLPAPEAEERNMRHDLTPVQERILNFITVTIREHDRSPTIREIGERVGISSTNGVRYHLSVLEKLGYIRRSRGISRGIEWLEHHPKIDGTQGATEIPIVGRVAAGSPILAVENIEGVLAVDEMITRSKECFALRVNGDSMKDAGIVDGDVVIVKPQPTARNGDIVVALLDDEATVKTYVSRRGRTVLRPENPEYEDIVLDRRGGDVRVLGKVVGLMRKL